MKLGIPKGIVVAAIMHELDSRVLNNNNNSNNNNNNNTHTHTHTHALYQLELYITLGNLTTHKRLTIRSVIAKRFPRYNYSYDKV